MQQQLDAARTPGDGANLREALESCLGYFQCRVQQHKEELAEADASVKNSAQYELEAAESWVAELTKTLAQQPAGDALPVGVRKWFEFPASQQHDNPQPADVGETAMPDFPLIWKVAKEHGYTVGLHGSMRRDVDLIAVPWVETHSTPQKLTDALCKALGARQLVPFEQKPVGRVATNLAIDGWYRMIDLSILAAHPAPVQDGKAKATESINRAYVDQLAENEKLREVLEKSKNDLMSIAGKFSQFVGMDLTSVEAVKASEQIGYALKTAFEAVHTAITAPAVPDGKQEKVANDNQPFAKSA